MDLGLEPGSGMGGLPGQYRPHEMTGLSPPSVEEFGKGRY